MELEQHCVKHTAPLCYTEISTVSLLHSICVIYSYYAGHVYLSVCPSVCLSCWHTHCDSLRGSMHTFHPDSKDV